MTNLTSWKEVQFPKISKWNEVFCCGRNYEVYFPKVKIKKFSESCFIRLFMKNKKIEEPWD